MTHHNHASFGSSHRVFLILPVPFQALVEGPCTDVPRQALNFKSLQLTDFVISISHSTKTKLVKKAFEDAEISKKWAESAWARKLERRRQRRLLSDFDRYKVKKLKQKVCVVILQQGLVVHDRAECTSAA